MPPAIAPRSVPQEDATFEYVVGCPLCGSERHEAALSATDPSNPASPSEFHIVRCAECGLHFINPRPTPESMGRFYATNYRPHLGQAHRDRRLRGWYPKDWLRKPALVGRRPRLLDFGCGAGHFLAAMDRVGWEAIGLDMSEAAVRAVRETIGLAALPGSLPHDDLEPATFNLITMWHSLEHVHDPAAVTREARRLLAPAGQLIVAVPNFAGFPQRWFGANWYGLDLPRHLTHFTPATLRQMLEASGFEVLDMRHPRHADWLRSSALLAKKRNTARTGQSLLRYRPVARFTASICQLMRSSDVVMILAQRR
jgi:2-polyprenyl-3-methyl-5-hydroxy-6-metoxy-1,4-benzoquinol methylase